MDQLLHNEPIACFISGPPPAHFSTAADNMEYGMVNGWVVGL